MSLDMANTQPTGYEDIDNLNNAQNELYNKAYEQQQNIINTQTQQNVDEINRNKDKLNEETTKQNQALYTDYTKQVNPYGATAESLAVNGLGNSGVAETTKTNLYNTYQNNRTNTLNTAKNLLAEYDAQIQKAKQNGDIQLAQSALQLYNQKISNLYNNYQLLQNQKQFDYQKDRDLIGDNQWQQQFDYNKFMDDRNYNYQVGRDEVTDKRWQTEFDYNKAIDDRNYNYQVGRDQVTDNQWKTQFDYNKLIDDRNYNYQVGRDNVADSQWAKEYALQQANARKKSSGSGNGQINIGDIDTKSLPQIERQQNTQGNPLAGGLSIASQIATNPQGAILSSLVGKVQNGEMSEDEANKVLDSINWK